MRACLPGNLNATQHSGEFVDAFLVVEWRDTGASRSAVGHLADAKVLIGETGDLGQVSDTQRTCRP